MADKITFTKDDPIKVNIKPEKSIKISNKTPSKINTNVSDIDSIPNYKKYEKERQDNELERIANENERKSNELERQDNESSRQAYIDNLKQRVLSGEFKGDKGDKGDNNTLEIGTVEQGTTANATITGESPNQTLNLVLPKGNKGEKGEKGNTGVWVGSTTPTDDSNVWIDPQGTQTTVPTKLSDLSDDSTHRTVTDVEKNSWNNKSDFSGAYADLTGKPDEITESTISNWGFTKNKGTYSKPNGGIPKTDLASAVQTSLGKADSALQEHQALKTINGNAITGTGNIVIESGTGGLTSVDHDNTMTGSGTNADPLGVDTTKFATAAQGAKADSALQPVSGKGLSTNDFTNTYKNNVDSNTTARHSHSNKTVLDDISSQDITNWNNKSDFNGVVQETPPTNQNIKLWINPDKMVKSPSNIIDMVYPVGSYYETSDTTFNPNTTWGGTWELEEDGTVLVSSSSTTGSIFNVDIGEVVGEEKHTLTVNEMPSHNHTMNAVRQWKSNGDHYWLANQDVNNAIENGTTSNTGGSQPHNIVQPSKIVNRWHRTA